MIRAAIIFLALALSAHAADIDVDRFVEAIRQVENYRGRDGRAGERGPWQITAAVWSMQMRGTPFAEARHEWPANACALKQVAFLRAELLARGVDDNAFNLALCWNAGFTAATAGRAPVLAYDYARRVVALLELRPCSLARSTVGASCASGEVAIGTRVGIGVPWRVREYSLSDMSAYPGAGLDREHAPSR